MLDKREMHIKNSNAGRLARLCSLTTLCFAACVTEEQALEQVDESEQLRQEWADELDGPDSQANVGGDYEVQGGLAQADCLPHVDSVTPTVVTLNQMTEFIIRGSCLPETIAVHIDKCAGMKILDDGLFDTWVKFQCKPSYETGPQQGVIKTEPDGAVITKFTVTVEL